MLFSYFLTLENLLSPWGWGPTAWRRWSPGTGHSPCGSWWRPCRGACGSHCPGTTRWLRTTPGRIGSCDGRWRRPGGAECSPRYHTCPGHLWERERGKRNRGIKSICYRVHNKTYIGLLLLLQHRPSITAVNRISTQIIACLWRTFNSTNRCNLYVLMCDTLMGLHRELYFTSGFAGQGPSPSCVPPVVVWSIIDWVQVKHYSGVTMYYSTHGPRVFFSHRHPEKLWLHRATRSTPVPCPDAKRCRTWFLVLHASEACLFYIAYSDFGK